jgi:DNA polymerase-4
MDEFQSYGLWLHHAARGKDDAPLVCTEEDPKSVGHSYTLPKDTWDPHVIRRYLLCLCDRVAWRLRRDGFVANRVSAYVRYGNFSGAGKQHRSQEPTSDGLKLFRQAWALIESVRNEDHPVRLVGISASDLIRAKEPTSLFKKEQKMARLLPALDSLQTKFGLHAWTRASLVSTAVLPRTSGFHFDHEI